MIWRIFILLLLCGSAYATDTLFVRGANDQGCFDAKISSGAATTNYGADTTLNAYNLGSGAGLKAFIQYTNWDTLDVLYGIDPDSVKLRLWATAANNAVVGMMENFKPFYEGNMTWTHWYDGATDSVWGSLGADLAADTGSQNASAGAQTIHAIATSASGWATTPTNCYTSNGAYAATVSTSGLSYLIVAFDALASVPTNATLDSIGITLEGCVGARGEAPETNTLTMSIGTAETGYGTAYTINSSDGMAESDSVVTRIAYAATWNADLTALQFAGGDVRVRVAKSPANYWGATENAYVDSVSCQVWYHYYDVDRKATAWDTDTITATGEWYEWTFDGTYVTAMLNATKESRGVVMCEVGTTGISTFVSSEATGADTAHWPTYLFFYEPPAGGASRFIKGPGQSGLLQGPGGGSRVKRP